jgi:hypothetical protein
MSRGSLANRPVADAVILTTWRASQVVPERLENPCLRRVQDSRPKVVDAQTAWGTVRLRPVPEGRDCAAARPSSQALDSARSWFLDLLCTIDQVGDVREDRQHLKCLALGWVRPLGMRDEVPNGHHRSSDEAGGTLSSAQVGLAV